MRDGERCASSGDCLSGSCRFGVCCGGAAASDGQCTSCNPGDGSCSSCKVGYELTVPDGTCDRLSSGALCSNDEECRSGRCANNRCCANNLGECEACRADDGRCAVCRSGYFLSSPDSPREQCLAQKGYGLACKSNNHCRSGFCLPSSRTCCDSGRFDKDTRSACVGCDNAGRCSSCAAGYSLLDGNCVRDCAPGCSNDKLINGRFDPECNTAACAFDAGQAHSLASKLHWQARLQSFNGKDPRGTLQSLCALKEDPARRRRREERPDQPCPDGWQSLDDQCYQVPQKIVNHIEDCAAVCAPGKLACVPSAQAEQVILSTRPTAPDGADRLRIWIDGSDSEKEGTWKCSDGRPIPYANWADGEPNNYGGIESLISLDPDDGWNDIQYASDYDRFCACQLEASRSLPYTTQAATTLPHRPPADGLDAASAQQYRQRLNDLASAGCTMLAALDRGLDPLGYDPASVTGKASALEALDGLDFCFDRLKAAEEELRWHNEAARDAASLQQLKNSILDAFEDQTSLLQTNLADIREAVTNNTRLLTESATMQQRIYEQALSNGQTITAVATKLEGVAAQLMELNSGYDRIQGKLSEYNDKTNKPGFLDQAMMTVSNGFKGLTHQ